MNAFPAQNTKYTNYEIHEFTNTQITYFS